MFWCSGIACLALLPLGTAVPASPPHSGPVDLRKWGYVAPPRPGASYGESYPSRLVSVHENGSVLVGFVTRDGEALGTRERPTLILHVVAFDREGKFLSELKFPTTMWEDNEIFSVAAGNVLVRTPGALTLCSEDGKVLAKKNLADPDIIVRAFPNREGVTVQRPHNGLEILSSRDLTTVKSCPYSYGEISSISNHNFAIHFSERLTDALPYRLRVSEMCGPTQFEYRWRVPGGFPMLLDDRRFVIDGFSSIELIDRDALRWQHSFGRGESAGELESDENGTILAVALSKYVGGSDLLDINGHLKIMRIIIYRTSDGKRLAQVCR